MENIHTGITHSGSFHTDDIISTALLRYFYPSMKVIRVQEYDGTPSEGEIVYDIGLGKFDHHQEERVLNDYGTPYSAFGLLWEHYGRLYLEKQGCFNIEVAFKKFKDKYVSKIDKGDNEGYKGIKDFFENMTILRCNSLWFEEVNEEYENIRFEKAVKLGQVFLSNWTRNVIEASDGQTFSITF